MGTVAATDLYRDTRPDYFGASSDQAAMRAAVPAQCCSELQVWSEEVYFPQRFKLTDKNHNEFPVYEALAGPLKVFFDVALNRWVISDNLDTTDYRAIGSNGSCPDFSNWKLWTEGKFSLPNLENSRVPYVNPEQMLECVPEVFDLEQYKELLIDSMCSKFD